MRRDPLFWYALAVLTLSFVAGVQGGDIFTGLLNVVVNAVVLVLPVVLFVRWRREKRVANGTMRGTANENRRSEG